MNWKVILTVAIGCIFIEIGVILPMIFPKIFDIILSKKLVISPESDMLKSFKKTPIPLFFEVYLFNITNPDEVFDGEKPILVQKGPYTYRQERYKHNITWNNDLGTVSYNEQRFYYFDPEKSVGSEDDEFTTLNPVFVSVGAKYEFASLAKKTMIKFFSWEFEDFQLFMTKKVKELTFSGYKEPAFEKLYEMTSKPKYKSGRMGFLYPKNGSIHPVKEIYSGELGMDNYQHVFKFNDKTKLDYWGSDNCNMINGTFGSQFAKPLKKTEPLYLFSTDLCRSIYLTYEKETKLGPLTLYRYNLSPEVLNVTGANSCFCHDEFTCRDSMVSISKCKDGAPIVMSTPHFYMGRERDSKMVEGLNPLEEEHDTYLEIEPNTGVTMRGSKKIQINIVLKQYSTFSAFSDVMEVIMPTLWVNEYVQVPLPRAEALYEKLTGYKDKIGYLSLIFVQVGLLVIFSVWLAKYCSKRKRTLNLNGKQEHFEMEASSKLLHGQTTDKIKC